MKSRNAKYLIPLSCLIIFVGYLAGEESLKKKNQNYILSRTLINLLKDGHYQPIELNDDLSSRIFKLYIESMDPFKQVFIQEDIDALKVYELQIDDQLNEFSLEFYDKTNELKARRISQISEFYPSLFEQAFDYEIDESYETDTEKREYSKDLDGLKDRWRKIIKNQIIIKYFSKVRSRHAKKNEAEADPEDSENSDDEKETQDSADSTEIADDEEKIELVFDPELEVEVRKEVSKTIARVFRRWREEDDQDRLSRFLNGVSSSFDPHSEYFPPERKEDFDIRLSGKLEGIGARLTESDDGYIKVYKIVVGFAAWRQKQLKADDLILRVREKDGKWTDLYEMAVRDAVKYIRGPKGEEVQLEVRKPEGSVMVISIVRDEVKIEETYARSAVLQDDRLNTRVGYIFLPKFYRDFDNPELNCSSDVKKEVAKLVQENVDGIILDLRSNGGGALEDAVNMSGLFIESGPIVQVRGRNQKPLLHRDPDKRIQYEGPLIVMVDALSASASEILAAALQDYGRAVIVGSPHSFGKGTVQTFVKLDQFSILKWGSQPEMGHLKMTIQKFFRINGGSTQYKGVESDIVLPDPYSYQDIGEKELDYSLPWDTVPPLTYKKWDKELNIPALLRRNKERVKDNSAFNRIEERTAWLKKQRENTRQSLNLMEAWANQEQLRIERKAFDELGEENPHIIVNASSVDPSADSLLPELLEKRQDWYSQLKKDVYLVEALHILDDMTKEGEFDDAIVNTDSPERLKPTQ